MATPNSEALLPELSSEANRPCSHSHSGVTSVIMESQAMRSSQKKKESANPMLAYLRQCERVLICGAEELNLREVKLSRELRRSRRRQKKFSMKQNAIWRERNVIRRRHRGLNEEGKAAREVSTMLKLFVFSHIRREGELQKENHEDNGLNEKSVGISIEE